MPHSSRWHSKQPLPRALLPLSHCSPESTTPLPQRSNRQSAVQPRPGFGGSHCSGPGSPGWPCLCENIGFTMPSPQLGVVQLALQAWLAPAVSHASWLLATPSPQRSITHRLEQPSPSPMLPSSHCSTPTCKRPSPQRAALQVTVHDEALLLAGPSSQSSTPASIS